MANEAVAVGGVLAGFALVFLVFWLIFIAAAIISFIFWIFMLIDVAKRKFKQENDKIMWILIVVLTGIIGALIYYFMVKKKNKN